MKLVHLVRHSAYASEGGSVRDNAFYVHFKSRPNTVTIELNQFKLLNLLKAIRCLMFRNRSILLHMSAMGFPVFNNGIIGRIAAFSQIFWLRCMTSRNRIFLEVNDLYVEQAKDLQLPIPRNFERIAPKIFKLKGTIYIFASESMRRYAIENYRIPSQVTLTAINGETPRLSDPEKIDIPKSWSKGKSIKFVYAGTLNKGRQIEEMIDVFKNSDSLLVLLGVGGNWIETKYAAEQNIFYLGAFDASHARAIVEQCDVGLIPYDESRIYYNIAYPTKVSSYLVAGIPILSTRVKEVSRLLTQHRNIGYSAKIEKWPVWIRKLSRRRVTQMKHQVALINHKFTWKNILTHLETEIEQIEHSAR